jgi:hypothetical protein
LNTDVELNKLIVSQTILARNTKITKLKCEDIASISLALDQTRK